MNLIATTGHVICQHGKKIHRVDVLGVPMLLLSRGKLPVPGTAIYDDPGEAIAGRGLVRLRKFVFLKAGAGTAIYDDPCEAIAGRSLARLRRFVFLKAGNRSMSLKITDGLPIFACVYRRDRLWRVRIGCVWMSLAEARSLLRR